MDGQARSQRVVITRPANATAYTALDAVGDASGSAIMQFADLMPPKQVFRITSVSVEYDVASVPVGCTFGLELYNASPTAIADNAAWSLAAADRASHVGSISLGAPVARGGSTLKVEVDNLNKLIKGGSTRTLFGILTATGGFTPAGSSEVLAVVIAGEPR